VNDLSRCLAALDQDSTLIAVIEMSQSSWLVAGIVPGVERHPAKKREPDTAALLRLRHRWPKRSKPGVGRSHRECGVVSRPIRLGEPAIGRRDRRDAGQGQLLRQAVLQGTEGALRTAARLERIGREVADANLRQSAPDLNLHGLRHRLPGLRRLEIVAAPVGISSQNSTCCSITSASARKLDAVPSSSTIKPE
jgi:hypothetical protein